MRNYFTSFLAFICVDSIWLLLIAPTMYRQSIGHLMQDQADLVAALLFYLIFLWGLNVFVIQAHRLSSPKKVMQHAALFGFVTYATFDLTSVAVFKDFPYWLAGVDLMWGATLSTLVTFITLYFDPVRAQHMAR